MSQDCSLLTMNHSRFDMGLVKGTAQRFAPEATLTHDVSAGCRQKGADSRTYLIHW